MGEPEGLLIEGARVAVAGARDLWWRLRPAGEPAVLALGRVRQRLELLLSALYGETLPILPADPEPAPTWLARLFGRAPRHLARAGALPATDGERVWLPRALDARDGEGAALDQYRLLAVEQAARVARGFAHAHPDDAPRIERDLYRLAEGAAVDRGLVRDLPGLAPGFRAARLAALAARPPIERLTQAERAVERIVRDVLAAELASPPPELRGIESPGDARAWARAEARHLRRDGRYRGVAPIPLWGEARRPAPAAGARAGEPPGAPSPRPGRAAVLRRRPHVRPARDDEDDAAPGTWMVRFDDPMESAEDPMGLERPADQDDSADAGELADALSELPEARVVRTPGTPREVLEGDAAPRAAVAGDPSARAGPGGIAYPEWDHRLAAYRHPGAIVRPALATIGGGEWAERVLDRHAAAPCFSIHNWTSAASCTRRKTWRRA